MILFEREWRERRERGKRLKDIPMKITRIPGEKERERERQQRSVLSLHEVLQHPFLIKGKALSHHTVPLNASHLQFYFLSPSRALIPISMTT